MFEFMIGRVAEGNLMTLTMIIKCLCQLLVNDSDYLYLG